MKPHTNIHIRDKFKAFFMSMRLMSRENELGCLCLFRGFFSMAVWQQAGNRKREGGKNNFSTIKACLFLCLTFLNPQTGASKHSYRFKKIHTLKCLAGCCAI